MKFLKKLFSFFFNQKKKKERPLPMNRAERRRYEQTLKRVYMKNIRSADGKIPSRKSRRMIAAAQARAHVARLHQEATTNPPKRTLTTLLFDWAYKIRLQRIKWRQQFQERMKSLSTMKPAMKGA